MKQSENVEERLKEICDEHGCLSAQKAVDELSTYFLGEDWYTTCGTTNDEVNPYIVKAIEESYPGYYRLQKTKLIWHKALIFIIGIIAVLGALAIVIMITDKFVEDKQLRNAINSTSGFILGSIGGRIIFKVTDQLETKVKIKRAVQMAFGGNDAVQIQKLTIKIDKRKKDK